MQELCAVSTSPQYTHTLFKDLPSIYMPTDKRPEENTTLCEIATTEGEEHTTCTCPDAERDSDMEVERDEQHKTETVTCTALGGGLGTLATVLVLILVGVVLGWVWSCHRNKIK